MAFRMVCPKCGTPNYSIERERSTYSRAEPVASLVFACTCGKRLYGKQVEDEYLRQKKAFEQNAEDRAKEEHAREQQEAVRAKEDEALSQAMAYRARFEAHRRAKEEAEAERSQQEQVERWREQALREPEDGERVATPADEGDLCAWQFCDKGAGGGRAIRRKGSKYCSRDCSNKNARWRHKQRKATPKSAKA